MKYIVNTLVFFILLVPSFFSVYATALHVSHKTPLIIDTDAGWDDWIAISYLIRDQSNSDYKIIGIISNGVGEARLASGINNIRNIVALAGASIPVYSGSSKPIKYSNSFPNHFRTSINDLFGIKIPSSDAPRPLISGERFLKNTLMNSQYKVDILAIGGLTDLASVIKSNPKLSSKINKLFVMGGDFDFSNHKDQNPNGNIQDFQPSSYPSNHTAEWNIFIDPVAAEIVFNHVKDIVMIPLNACRYLKLTQSFVSTFPMKNALDKFIHKVLEYKLSQAKLGGYQEYFYDPLSAVIASGNKNVSQFKEHPVFIYTKYNSKDDHSGTTYIKKSGRVVSIAVNANISAFEEALDNGLSKQSCV